MASLKDLIVMGPARFLDKLYGNLEGNATSADKLKTARNINGTSFDGTTAITTANWGTARNIYIEDSDGSNKGAAVSVNGGANATLKLPATIKATLSGNASTATTASYALKMQTYKYNSTTETYGTSYPLYAQWNQEGKILNLKCDNYTVNTDTATKLATARTINGTSFDGSTNITTTNWGTARTLTIGNKGQSVNGSTDYTWSLSDMGAVAKSGDTMTGDLKFTTHGLHFIPGNTDQYLWKVYSSTDGSHGFRLQYNGTGSGNDNSLSLIADNQDGTEVKAATILQDGTITLAETLTLAKTTDASGTANKKPALIVGGTSTTAHLELDNNELMAKKDGTTVIDLYLNSEGGLVHIGSGGLQADASNIEALSTDASYRAIKATNSNGSVGVYAASNRGLKDFTADNWIIYRSEDGTKTYIPQWGTKGSASLPAYFSGGEPIACTADSVFSALSWTAGTTSGPVLKVTVATKARTATIPSASGSASGIVTTGSQAFGGAKGFNGEVTMQNSNWNPLIRFKAPQATGNTATIYNICSDGTNLTGSYFKFRQYSYTANSATSLETFEDFNLPTTGAGRTSNAQYEIFTSKSYTTLDSRYVTLSTTQTISGAKTFTSNPPILSNAAYYGSIRFAPTKTNGSRIGEIYCFGTNTDTLTSVSFNFRTFSYTSGTYTPLSTYEAYSLPAVNADRTSSTTYEIFTSKNYGTLDARYVTLSTAQTISGNKTFTGHVYYKTTNYTAEPIKIKDMGSTNGAYMLVEGGGPLYVGGGEGATNMQSKLTDTAENLYLGADGLICFYPNCDADTLTATSGIEMTSSLAVRPQVNGAGSLGSSSYRWGGVYSTAANISGTVTANAATLSGTLTANSVSASSYDGCCKIYKHSWANGNLAAGWYRIAKIAHVSGGGYSTGIIITHGNWDSGEPTSAVFVVSGVHNTPMITQVGGTVGEITQMRLTGASGGYYLEAYKTTDTPSGSNFSTQYLTLIGNFNPTFYTPTTPDGAVSTNSAYVKIEDRGNINYGSTAYANPQVGDIWLCPV